MDDLNIEQLWGKYKEVLKTTPKETLGIKQKKHKPWLTFDTEKLIEERNKLKQKILNSRTDELKKRLDNHTGEKINLPPEQITEQEQNDVLIEERPAAILSESSVG
ncbi:hypothetical protein FQA39_LY00244 [Lamprigera yunnana]|nr:hypothetical protein FQA39_LY00244 [Lamprigera yunnana]